MKLRALALAVCFAATAVAPSLAAPTAAALPCGLNPEPVRTLKVQAKASKKAYRRGTPAEIKVKVTRFYEDPSDKGYPLPLPEAGPAEGVTLSVGIYSADGTIYQTQGAITDDQGKSTMRMKLKPYHEPGPADIQVGARKDHYSEQCITIIEYGYFEKSKFFRIK